MIKTDKTCNLNNINSSSSNMLNHKISNRISKINNKTRKEFYANCTIKSLRHFVKKIFKFYVLIVFYLNSISPMKS